MFFHKKEMIFSRGPALRKFAWLFFAVIFGLFGFWQWKNKQVGAHTLFLPISRVQDSFKKNLRQFYFACEMPEFLGDGYTLQAQEKFQAATSTPFSFLHWSFRALGAKFSEYWTLSIVGSSQTWRNSLVLRGYLIYYGVTFVCMGLSFFFFRRNPWALAFLWMILVYFTLVHMVTLRGGGAANRYRVPLEPYMGILAAYGMVNTLSGLRGRFHTQEARSQP